MSSHSIEGLTVWQLDHCPVFITRHRPFYFQAGWVLARFSRLLFRLFFSLIQGEKFFLTQLIHKNISANFFKEEISQVRLRQIIFSTKIRARFIKNHFPVPTPILSWNQMDHTCRCLGFIRFTLLSRRLWYHTSHFYMEFRESEIKIDNKSEYPLHMKLSWLCMSKNIEWQKIRILQVPKDANILQVPKYVVGMETIIWKFTKIWFWNSSKLWLTKRLI